MSDSGHKETRTLLWMFDNDKKNERQPDLSGPGRINKDVLKDMVDAYKELGDGEKLELRCAGWHRKSKNGKPYLFVTIEPDRPLKPVQPDDLEPPF